MAEALLIRWADTLRSLAMAAMAALFCALAPSDRGCTIDPNGCPRPPIVTAGLSLDA